MQRSGTEWIYRLAQEALTHIVKHAEASKVIVEVSENSGGTSVRVVDDGDGFAPDDAGGGFGLLGIRERVALVSGSVEVLTEPGSGTTVAATIPSQHRPEGGPSAQPSPTGATNTTTTVPTPPSGCSPQPSTPPDGGPNTNPNPHSGWTGDRGPVRCEMTMLCAA